MVVLRYTASLLLLSHLVSPHAQALKAAFDDLYPGAIDADIVDLWTTHAPWPLNKSVESYQFMAKRPAFWRAFWEWGRFPPTRRMTLVGPNLFFFIFFDGGGGGGQ